MRLLDLDLQENIIWVKFNYDPELVNLVKTISGRRYDGTNKQWSVPLSAINETIEKLSDRQFKYSPAFREYLDDMPELPEEPATQTSSPNPSDKKAFSVSQLNFQAQEVLRGNFPLTLLLDGEVAGLARNKKFGHAYFELIDRPSAGAPIAKVNAVCFAAARARISGRLARVGNKILDGEKYRFIVKPELYTKQGQFQVVIEDIEMEAIFSKAKLRRDAAIKTLTDEKILNLNLKLEMPPCPLRIGLITSLDSDAYNDFIHELEISGFNFDVVFYPAKMQGVDASESLTKAIRSFEKKDIDILAVVRGGGAKSSLADLDSIDVGRAVCESMTKVICGIGHHRDQGVLDAVSLGTKTPTAAAQLLVQTVASYLQAANRIAARIATLAEDRIAGEQYHLENISRNLSVGVLKHTRETELDLNRLADAIPTAASYYVRRYKEDNDRMSGELVHLVERNQRRQENRLASLRRRLEKLPVDRQLNRANVSIGQINMLLAKRSAEKLRAFKVSVDHLEKQLEWMKPRRTLERGYAIMRKQDEIVKSVRDVKVGEELTSTLRDGRLVLSVKEIEEREK